MKLLAITNDKESTQVLMEKIIAIKDEVDYIHIREKTKKAKTIYHICQKLLEAGVAKEKLVLNDRLDIALLLDIPTIHLPIHGLPISAVKKKYPKIKIGASVHSLQEALQAEVEGADYVIYGHCFVTECKPGLVPNGVERLAEIKKMLTIPVYAIGGINIERIPIIMDAMADGIAVMSGIFAQNQYKLHTKQLKEALGGRKDERNV